MLSKADLDRFSRSIPKSDVDLGGDDTVSLSSTSLDKAAYLASVKRQIELTWTYPEEAGRKGIGGDLVLAFTIGHNGKLENVELEEPSGYRILDEEAMRAVKMAAPYNPLPDRMHRDRLRIRAVFRYIIDNSGIFHWIR
ncbi:MAG TPA: energy transducer TonB [bacterium]|nr:energy transducer TonB [bacterium]